MARRRQSSVKARGKGLYTQGYGKSRREMNIFRLHLKPTGVRKLVSGAQQTAFTNPPDVSNAKFVPLDDTKEIKRIYL